MEEYILNKILEKRDIFKEEEIEFINKNKEVSFLLYLVGAIDTIQLYEKL